MSATLIGALPHVFLPKRTPGSEQRNLSSIQAYILGVVNRVVSKYVEENLLELSEIERMFQAWVCIQPWTSFDSNLVQTFVDFIKDDSHKTIPIYVKSQNCTVLFEKENDKVRMETYRSSLPTQVVMGNIHDLIMTFPETSKIVRNGVLLQSKVFAKALLELSTESVGVPPPSQDKPLKGSDKCAVTEPFLVNDFLSGLLCAGNKLEGDDNYCKISKKLRDQVTFSPGANPQAIPPFRRSGIWMSVKVALQLKVRRLIKDKKAARALYKLLMLRIVTEFCERYFKLREEIQMDLDLMAQILANIGQRVCKLQDLCRAIDEDFLEDEERDVIFDQLEEFKDVTFEMVYGVVDKVKNFMNLCIFKEGDAAKLTPRTIEAYLEDLDHQITFSEPDIHKSLAEIEREAHRSKGKTPISASKDLERSKELQRYSTAKSVLSGWGSASKSADKQRVWLHDTETYLKTDLKSKSDSGTILKVACEYLEHAVKAYQGQNDNPLGTSQIFLCLLKVLEELDRRAVSRHPLPLKYKCGVKPEYFQNLILPYKEDFDLLDRALSYFQSRDDVATQIETIFPEEITSESLSVQFVEESEVIRERLKMINKKVEEHINHKIKTVQNVREDCENIRDCYAEEPRCESDQCGKNCDCWRSYLEKDLEKKKESVLIYEKPLPVEDHLQKAVMFELYIPPEISILRDALLILQKGLLKEPDFWFLLEKSEELQVNWRKYEKYRGYLDKPTHPPSQFVSFGSTVRSNGQSVISRKNPNVLSASDEDFISENGLQLQYSFSFMELKVTNRPTFKILSMANWQSYLTLQRYLESWNHSQNEVICNQNDCQVDLSLEEFIAYGSLRAGHRIQLRNLYRALASNALSMSEEPVLALLLQTVWQMGPRSEAEGKWEAHEDFTGNDEFCLEFLSLLEKIVKDNENNYAHPCTLIGAVVIAVRIMESNKVALKKGKELLRGWRALMRTWRGKIEKNIQKEEEYVAAKLNVEENIEDLKKNLLLINVCSALSYNLSKDTIWEMFRNGEEDMVGWFHTVNYFNLMESYVGGLSRFMRLLHGLGRNVALRLKVEEKDLTKSFAFKWVKRFVGEKWSKAGECHEPVIIGEMGPKNLLELRYEVKWKQGERSEVKMEVESEEESFEVVEKEELEEVKPGPDYHIITFDFVLGTFLVNGYPAGHLPAEVTQNPTFKHFFGKTNSKLVVQQESECVFRTSEKFHGKDYEFYVARGRTWTKTKNPVVLVKQVQNKDEKRILLEPSELEGVLQDNFVQDYTHWLHQDSGIIDFKRKCKQDSDYDRKVEYRLIKNESDNEFGSFDTEDSDVWKFYDEGNKAHLLSIKSDGFRNLTEFLSRLEMKQFMNVLVDRDALENVTVHLPRYNLRFKVKLDLNCLESVEYPGYLMTGEVETSTLVGLQQGIQLRKGEKRMLLLPNGDVHLEKGAYHHKTVISLDDLRQPAYFKYEYDEVLKRLVGNNSKVPYLYLAALHAMTSLTSGQTDPFTGVTGTEMALRILQSGFIWSSSPFDEDCRRILKVIKELSPERRSYGEGEEETKPSSGGEYLTVEVIEWMKILPSLSAHDAFELIVWKLIRDSEKLKVLHGGGGNDEEDEDEEDENDPPKFLRAMAYFKYLNYYNSSAKLELSNVDVSPLAKLSKPVDVISNGADRFFLTQLCNVAYARHITLPRILNSFEPETLTGYLHNTTTTQSKPIVWNTPNWTSSLRLAFNNTGLRENWFWLYKMASKKQKTCEEVQILTLLLSVLAYNGAPLKQILNLHYLSVNADQLELPEVPESMPGQTQSIPIEDPSKDEIRNFFHGIVNRHWRNNKPHGYLGTGNECYNKIMTCLTENWLNISVQLPIHCSIPDRVSNSSDTPTLRIDFVNNYCDSNNVMKEARVKISQWHSEKQFRDFVKTIQAKLQLIQEQSESPQIFAILLAQSVTSQIQKNDDTAKYGGGARLVDFGKHLYSFLNRISLDENILNKARSIFNGDENAIDDLFDDDFVAQRSRLLETVQEILKVLLNSAKFDGKILHCTSIYPRKDPTTLLQTLLQIKRNLTAIDEKTKAVCSYIGALAVLWTKIKRLYRCIAFQSAGQETELQRELQNQPHENWKPSKRPEWLCLELELDIIILSKQVEVAKQMKKMPSKGNGVMQLNMGEGKTSVIVPMLCCVLGGEDKLCRVTILASMLNMNYKILSYAIGGIINKRIYLMPCRRDMEIDLETVKTIQESYDECLKLQGVVLALPEHRLSFRLLAYDKLLKGKTQLGLKLWETENWLQRKVRNVLDESDELLNAKYQLVYTVGGKIELDGGDLRWSCCHTLLHILKGMGPALYERYGESCIEFDGWKFKESPHEFPGIRFLNLGKDIIEKITSDVADELLRQEEFALGRSEVIKVKEFLTKETTDKLQIQEIVEMFKEDSHQLNKIFIYSGYLRRGILPLGLSKRWRVEYGVDFAKTQRLMAVPFRAKDFPVERTEFGHPDLAILLTHLSYYYSGLSDKQMEDVMELLRKKSDADSIYRLWIEQVPDEKVPGDLRSFYGINFKDSQQRQRLYNLLRHNTHVINFWLSKKVFPRECKQFPSKLVMSAWDLCNEKNAYPTTGFSGTNDSSILLPLQITQQDLPSLLDTNAKMGRTLVKPENKGHRHFQMGVTCREILEQMTKDGLRVLIDAGALMLDKDNEEVARLWLELNQDLEGVLYFNKKNDLTVKCRGSGGEEKDVSLELSPYHGSLEKVGVFLDDQHTRGTDLKFPNEWRAVVTIGAGMKRDKLTQACMRMRKLDQGQCVTFYLSHEVFDKILNGISIGKESLSGGVFISSEGILKFAEGNTRKFNEDGLVHWAIGGKNYAQRLLAEDNFCNSTKELRDEERRAKYAMLLARRCVDDEVTSLEGMYGKHASLDKLVKVIPNWFHASWRKIKNPDIDPDGYNDLHVEVLNLEFKNNFERIRDAVVKRCGDNAPDKLHFSSGDNMEEEQEKELELELEKEAEEEEERVIEKPRKLQPAPNYLHPNVRKFIEGGEPLKEKEGIERLSEIFKETHLNEDLQSEAWDGDVYASGDFNTVTEEEKIVYTDEYLRPIEYYAAVTNSSGGTQVLLLSPFEVNEMMPVFKDVENPTTLHMFLMRRSEKQGLLWDNQALTLPHGSRPSPLHEMSLSALLLASGNLYFGSKREQRSFAEFLCLAPKPWTEEEERGCEAKQITKTGFMMPGYEGRRDSERNGGSKGFSEDPSGLVRRILKCRHSVVNEISHVVRLLDEKKFPDLK